jgi:hypothetical protein
MLRKICQLVLRKKNNNVFFSQEGEDYLLTSFLSDQRSGFFVDLGSAHPIIYNNTYYFYLRGWRGICIDASPNLKKLYTRYRPEDKFINTFISRKPGIQKFHIFSEPLLNTGSLKRKNFLQQKTNYKFQKTVSINKTSLRDILKKYLPHKTKIQIMSIDIEESELEALESNNWNIYRPMYIVMEVLHHDRDKIGNKTPVQFLKALGYRITTILPRSVIFSDS